MLFNIAPEPVILFASGISLLFFPRLLRFSVTVILPMVAYFRAATKSVAPTAFLPGKTGKGDIATILQFDLSTKAIPQWRKFYEIKHKGSNGRQTASGERKSQ